MSKTLFVVETVLTAPSNSEALQFLHDLKAVCDRHKVSEYFVTQSGPYPAAPLLTRGNHASISLSRADAVGAPANGGRLERGPRADADARAAEDFGEGDEGSDGASAGPDADADVKPRRGRPPGSGKRAEAGSGKAEGGRKRTGDAPAGGSGEDARGDEPVRTRQGADEGARQGQGGQRGARGGRDDQRGDREASRVDAKGREPWDDAPPAPDRGGSEDWNDESDEPETRDIGATAEEAAKWPEGEWPDNLTPADVTENTIAELLAAHFAAAGGKDRSLTFAVMEAATGERSVKNVHPDDFDKLARALLHDAARYKYGVKKPAK